MVQITCPCNNDYKTPNKNKLFHFFDFPKSSAILHYNKDLYDESIYPPTEEALPRFAISKRNEWMVEQADVVISCIDHDWGGAATTLKYAKRKKKPIISVAG